MNKKKDFAEIIALLACLALIFFNSVYYVSQKEDFFLDEKWTFLFANSKIISLSDFISELKESNFAFDAMIMDISDKAIPVNGKVMTLDDVNAMMNAQIGDKFTPFSTLLFSANDSHPPFYYLLFNFLNSVISGISLKNTGFFINIVALLITCFLIYKIIVLIENRLCGIFAVLFYGLSFEFVNNVTYFRMYALLTMFFTLILYLYLKWALSGYSYDANAYLRAILVVELFSMLTQYLAAIYIIPFFIISILFMSGNKISPKRYIFGHIWIAVIYTVLWPFSLYRFLVDESGRDVRNTASLLGIPLRVAKYIRILVDSLFAGSKIIFICVVALIAVYILLKTIKMAREGKAFWRYKNKKVECFVFLIIPTAIFYIVIADIAPWTVDRYMMPIIAVVSVVIAVMFWRTLQYFLKREWLCATVVSLLLVFLFVLSHRMTPYYLYPISTEKQAFINKYENEKAMIVEADDQIEFVDIFLSVDHPYWKLVRAKDLAQHLNEMGNEFDSYVLYINTFCNKEDVINTFNDKGINVEEIDYSREFYDVYYIR